MHTCLLFGATGMIGKEVLNRALASPKITKVICITRTKLQQSHPKLTEVLLENFNDLASCAVHFKQATSIYYCIGVYTGQVPKPVFETITIHYTKLVADLTQQYAADATFCFLSGMGADSSETSKTLFARCKGIAENYLLKTLPNILIFRPGYIYPVHPRKAPNLFYSLSKKCYPLIKLLGPKYSITSLQLTTVFFELGLQKKGQLLLENTAIYKSAQQIEASLV